MVSITILNDIVHSDFPTSLDIQRSWGITLLDLRAGIYGKPFIQLDDTEIEAAIAEIRVRGMSVYCLSSGLFYDDLNKGEAHFWDHHLGQVDRLIQVANRFEPTVVRLLSARFDERDQVADSIPYLQEQYPWLMPLYQEAIDRLHAAGHQVTIENEARNCILATPIEIVQFFEVLDRRDQTSFTFDVQNIWKMGTFPTMEVYRELAPLIGYFHLKGGLAGDDGRTLRWKSALEDASWPVVEMTDALVRDGRSQVICLNPSHGEDKDGYDYRELNKRNLDYLRNRIASVR